MEACSASQPPVDVTAPASWAAYKELLSGGPSPSITKNVDIRDLVMVRLPSDLRSMVWKTAPLVLPFYEMREGDGYAYMRNVGQRPLSYLADSGFKADEGDLRAVLRVHYSYLGEIAFGAAAAWHFGGEDAAAAFCDDVRQALSAYRERLLAYAGGEDITAGEWKRRIEDARRAGDCPGIRIGAAPGVVYGVVIGGTDGSKDYEIIRHDGSVAAVDVKNYAHIKHKAQHSSHYVVGEDHFREDGGVMARSMMVDVRQYDGGKANKTIYVQTLIAREAALQSIGAHPNVIDLRNEADRGKALPNDTVVVVAGAMIGLSLCDLALPANAENRTRNCNHLPREAIAAARVLGKVRQPCFERAVSALEPPKAFLDGIGGMVGWGEIEAVTVTDTLFGHDDLPCGVVCRADL